MLQTPAAPCPAYAQVCVLAFRLNLASFVTTWMEPECEEIMTESYNINYIDESEYPSTTSIQNRHAWPLCSQVGA